MMEEEQYCLKWNNHQTTLLSNLTGLMDTEKLFDCYLSAEGKTVKSHQVVISACSPYLERLLNECRQPGIMPIVVFSDLAYDELVALREYMYKGEVNIRQNALDSFLKAAHSLQIKGLADGGGGGGDDGGGGGKRKAENDSMGAARRRRRRESRESDDHDHQTQSPVQAPVKKQNVFSNSSNYDNPPAPQVKLEPVEHSQLSIPHSQAQSTPMIKAEHHEPAPETHDLTGADDDYEDDGGYEMPGTSQPDLSQDMSNWQMDNSMNSEDFVAAQSAMAQQPGQSSQGNVKTRKQPSRSSKESHIRTNLTPSEGNVKTRKQPSRSSNESHNRTNLTPSEGNTPRLRNEKTTGNRSVGETDKSTDKSKSTKSGNVSTQKPQISDRKSNGNKNDLQSRSRSSSALKTDLLNTKTEVIMGRQRSEEIINKIRVQPLEFIDISATGNNGIQLDEIEDCPRSPKRDPLAIETELEESNPAELSSLPLFNFMTQNKSDHNIDVCIDISDEEYNNVKNDDVDSDDGEDNLVIAEEEEICSKCHSLATPNHLCVSNTLVKESEDKESKEKKCKKKRTRTKSQDNDDNKRKRTNSTDKKLTKPDIEENDVVFTCMICSLQFKRERELLLHGLYRHGETSPYDGIQCNLCEHTTSTIGSLYSHLNSVHFNQPKFKCHHCIYEASDPSVFHMHVTNNHAKLISKNKLQVKASTVVNSSK